ncbi:hypothetical protein [Pseudarthrobacter sp. DSP2-3-2b1]|uniref:hypothetical protein n=1 Tax=Pseudarthrobacter sp. DSP2-3-2b1 TaxID=2804661 RepID=UPI003CF3BEF5
MKPIEEQVQLPDPRQQFLVHPLDLPAARKEYLKGWWLGIAATPQVFTALLAALWAVSNNHVTPVLVPLLLAVAAGFTGSRFTRAAWDYIPRRRQDTRRRPSQLAAAEAAIKALALLAGLAFFLWWAAAQDFSSDFIAYPLGTGAALILVLAADLAVRLGRGRGRGRDRDSGRGRDTGGDILGGLLTLLVASGAVWAGFALLPGGANSFPWSGLLAGALTLMVVWALWLAYSARQARRNHAPAQPQS